MKVGDIVQLKSGGPAMTVLKLEDAATLTCIWYASQGEDYRSRSFPRAVLDRIEYDDEDEDSDEQE
ncbi:MAG: DUF2158 domain-containing protein [Xanthobacteraceae bacterium]|nr:MAG: DUF2158 domain-containing protein [Xanthobacteraceae bacterium]